MVSPVNGGIGAINMLNVALSGSKPGEFKPKTTAVTNIQTTLGNSDFQANQQLIYRSAINRLEGIRQGLIEPNQNNEWEVVGAYLAATGQPFKLQIDEGGQLAVEAQAESSLSEFNDAQKLGILNAIQQFDQIAGKVDENSTRETFRGKFDYAYVKMIGMENYFPPEEQWELDFELYKGLGQPVQIGLDANGDLIALNQLEHDFAEYEDFDDRFKLLQAQEQLKNILNGTLAATEDWQYLALGNKSAGDDYLLTLDDDGEIEIRQNLHRLTDTSDRNLDHLIPSFLNEETDLGTTSEWQEQAAALYQEGKPFYFDFAADGKSIVTREIDLIHSMGLHRPVDRSDLIIQAQLSILV